MICSSMSAWPSEEAVEGGRHSGGRSRHLPSQLPSLWGWDHLFQGPGQSRGCVRPVGVLKSLLHNDLPAPSSFRLRYWRSSVSAAPLPTVTATKPNAIISLDITIATDTPIDKPLHPVAMRKRPAIKMMDFHGRGTLGGLFSAPKLRRFIEKVARQEDIPLQREVIVGVITDPAFQLYLDDKGYVIAGYLHTTSL